MNKKFVYQVGNNKKVKKGLYLNSNIDLKILCSDRYAWCVLAQYKTTEQRYVY